MLFRMVRPMRREGSRNQYYVRRIPADVRDKATGLKLTVPLGDGETQSIIIITARMQAVKFSLGTHDPVEVKARNAAADAYLEKVWQALRQDTPIKLTNEQATALAGRLYRAWARGEGRELTVAVEEIPITERIPGGPRMRMVADDPREDADMFTAVLERMVRPSTIGKHEMDKPKAQRKPIDLDHFPPADEEPEAEELEQHLGPLVDRLLRGEGIGRVDQPSRGLLLVAVWRALRDALELRLLNAQGDYSPDPKAERFPAWVSPLSAPPSPKGAIAGRVSLTALVDGWWTEGKARGLKPSTRESYSNTMKAFVAFLEHDDAGHVTQDDVLRFKDHRLATINPRTGKNISAKTVKDSDLAGLKALLNWAVANRKMASNPATDVTLKRPRKVKLRIKGFTEIEAKAILKASLNLKRGREQSETYAAKRWVPWLMAYSGARVGEMAQLRKEDLQRSGKIWYLRVTPEAGTVKTDEARDVALHPHLIEMGFVDFVKSAPRGHLFVRPADDDGGDEQDRVLGPLKGLTNRLAEFARDVVKDKGVAPNHGWRHRFKPIGVRAGIDRRTLDVISGHALEGRTVADGYHGVELEDQAAALKKYPRYDVT